MQYGISFCSNLKEVECTESHKTCCILGKQMLNVLKLWIRVNSLKNKIHLVSQINDFMLALTQNVFNVKNTKFNLIKILSSSTQFEVAKMH